MLPADQTHTTAIRPLAVILRGSQIRGPLRVAEGVVAGRASVGFTSKRLIEILLLPRLIDLLSGNVRFHPCGTVLC